MQIKVDVDGLQREVAKMMKEYNDVIYNATEESLDAAADVLVNNLKTNSPKKTGKFARSWKSTGKQYKLMRFVGNTDMVKSKKGEIALSDIIEFSITRGHPFINQTNQNSLAEMAAAFVAKIKNKI